MHIYIYASKYILWFTYSDFLQVKIDALYSLITPQQPHSYQIVVESIPCSRHYARPSRSSSLIVIKVTLIGPRPAALCSWRPPAFYSHICKTPSGILLRKRCDGDILTYTNIYIPLTRCAMVVRTPLCSEECKKLGVSNLT